MAATSPDPRIEAAKSADAVAMRDLVQAAYVIYVDRMGREPAPMRADYDQLVRSGRARIVRQDGRLVGLLVTELLDDALLVDNIAVHPAAQARGIGSLLLQEAERLAQAAGRRQLRLYTNEAMTENIAYYRRRGFTETHRATTDGYRRVYFTRPIAVLPCSVRPAQPEDRDALWPLARDFATSFTVEREAFARVFAALLQEPRALLLVATTTEDVIGYLLAHTHDAFLANGPITWVEEVMVAAEHRGAGIGRALMNAAEQWAQDAGAAYVALASHRAGAFYLALGYTDSAAFYKKTLGANAVTDRAAP